jgi:hypothetical protein
MAGYVPRKGAQKRKGILGKREDELRHHLRHLSSVEVVERFAERVRAGQLAVIKALLYETEPAKGEDTQHSDFRQILLAKQKFWLGLTKEKIAELYRTKKAD